MRTKRNISFPLENIMDALPNYVFWKDKNFRYLGCNTNAARLLGLISSSDIIGKSDSELPWKEYFAKQSQVYDAEVIHTGKAKTDVGEVLSLKDGKVIEVITDRKPFYDDKGKIAGVLIISIESRKRNLADQTFFEHILKSLPYYIFWKNKESVYLGCNDNFARLIGKNSSKDVIGLTDFDMGWGEGEAEFYRQADQKVMSERNQVNLEEILKRPDGSNIVMLVSKVPVRNNQRDTVGMLGISVDITNIKKAEQELKISKEKAELANQAKSDFISNMSHDLRTPLNIILGIADVLRIKRHLPEQTHAIESITRAGKNLLGLIEDILSFSKLEAGKLELHSESFDMRQLIEEVVSMTSYQATQKKLRLITSYADNIPRHVISDPHAIRRILINLLSNAIKFTESGHVMISVEEIEKKSDEVLLQILVEDTGIGIPGNKLEVIFDRFSRVEPSYKSKYEGIGLGLTIVKQLANNLGGDIKVNSKLGYGSTFYCTLPFKLQKITKFSPKIVSPISKSRVLIVDDYYSEAEVFLKQLDADCQIVKGNEAIYALSEAYKSNKPFDIVIVDDEIKNLDPLVLAKNIRVNKKFNKPLLVLFTRPVSLAQTEKAIEAGFAKLLIKPVQPSEIINGITELWKDKIEKDIPKNPKFKNINVLLVEDDVASQMVGKILLEELGCKVQVADSGKKALALFKNIFDIVFMDIGLSDMSGLAVAKKIRKLENKKVRQVPIIALTAHVSREDEQQCMMAGMNGFLTKPISYEELEKFLEKFFNSKSTLKQDVVKNNFHK